MIDSFEAFFAQIITQSNWKKCRKFHGKKGAAQGGTQATNNQLKGNNSSNMRVKNMNIYGERQPQKNWAECTFDEQTETKHSCVENAYMWNVGFRQWNIYYIEYTESDGGTFWHFGNATNANVRKC